MGKQRRRQFEEVKYALIARDKDGKKVGNTGSSRDEEGTRRMCHEIMRLIPAAAFVDIYDWHKGLDLATVQPKETVRREDGRIFTGS